MSDDPTQVLRVYFVVDCATLAVTPTEKQWDDLTTAAKKKLLAAGILSYAKASQNFISVSKRAQGTGLMKYTLGCFEVDADDKARALDLLATAATAYSVTGTARNKFALCLQAELRQAALDLGYAAAQANKINVTVINTAFDRMTAISQAQAYIAANDAIWHSAEK